MSALLAFQFCPRAPRQEKINQTVIGTISYFGLVFAIGVVTFLIWRIISLLRHPD
jgi:hypothetical protein